METEMKTDSKGLKNALFPPIDAYEDYSLRYSKGHRIFMFIEAIAMYFGVMVMMWVFWWQESPYHNMTIATSGLVAIIVYILILSPIIHKDKSEDWGLGSVVDYFQLMLGKPRKRKPGVETPKSHRIIAILWFTLIQVAFVVAIIMFWDVLAPEAVDWLDGLIQNLRFEEGLGISITENDVIGAVIAAVILLELIIFGMFRYDNFKASMKEFIKMAAINLPIYIVFVLVYYYGAQAGKWEYLGKQFEIGDFLVSWLGYVIWGSIQQLLFLGYFNTRVRKSMLGYKWKYAKYAPLLSTFVCAWFFAIIHLPSLLALFTFIGGAFWAWYFQKKGSTNILVAGIFHGLFGTLLGSYLSFIPFSVGPEKITF